MKTDPRIQRFWDEVSAIEREMKQLTAQIAAERLDFTKLYMASLSPGPYERLLPEIKWAITVRRPDIAIRLINLCEAHEEASASVTMMTARVEMEAHQETVKAQEAGFPPEYLDEEDGAPPVRMSPEEAKFHFPPDER